jgi:mono/diheme cytochrome c family protein
VAIPKSKLRQEIAMKRFFVLVVAASAIASGAAGDVQAPDSASAANGKRLFEKVGCYECHGYAAQGGRDGARLAATSMNAQSFTRYIRRPFGAMPAYTTRVISDQELADIYAYVRGLPAAKPSKDIPLLNSVREK